MYLSGGQALRTVEAHGRMNEDAQMALAAITHELRQAGYNPGRDASGAKNDLGQKGWSLFACDMGFTGTNAASRNIRRPALQYRRRLCAGRGLRRRPQHRQEHREQRPAHGLRRQRREGHARRGPLLYVLQARLYVEGNVLMCRGSGGITAARSERHRHSPKTSKA
jgi:type IV pilus assembly protein PilW